MMVEEMGRYNIEKVFEELFDVALLEGLSNCGLLITKYYSQSHRHVYITHPKKECNKSEALCPGH
jgi:hypothetical protein